MAVTIEESKSSTSDSSLVNTRTITFDTAPQEGELITIVADGRGAPSSGASLSLSDGTWWELHTSQSGTNTGSRIVAVWWRIAGASEPASYTVTLNDSVDLRMTMAGQRRSSDLGFLPTPGKVSSNNASSNTAGSSVSTGTTATTTANTKLAIAWWLGDGAAETLSLNNSFTLDQAINNTLAGRATIINAYKALTGAETVEATLTAGSNAASWKTTAIMGTFLESSTPATTGTVSTLELLASPETGKTLRFFVAGIDAEDVAGFTPGKSCSVTADGGSAINATFVSAQSLNGGSLVTAELATGVLSAQVLVATVDAGLIADLNNDSLSFSGSVVNASVLTAQPSTLTAAEAISATTIDLTFTLPSGSFGTVTADYTKFKVWAVGGYGLVGVSSAVTQSDSAITSVVRLTVDRDMYTDEFVDIEILSDALSDTNGNTLEANWRAIRNIDMSSADSPPATTVVVSCGRSEITLSVATAVTFYADGTPAIDVGEGSVNITATAPAESTSGGEAINGAWLNPDTLNEQPYDERGSTFQNYEGSHAASYPLACSKYDCFVKARSAVTTTEDGATSSHQNAVEWYSYYHFVDDTPAATELAPPAFGYDGSTARPVIDADIDTLIDDLPSFDLSGISGTAPDFEETIRRIGQPNPARCMGENAYYRRMTPVYFTPAEGYGSDYAEIMGNAYILLMSDLAEASKRELAMWVIHHGTQLYWARNATDPIPENGAHEQGFMGALVLGLTYTGSVELLDQIKSVVGMNELNQTYLWTQTDIDRVTNRTNHYALDKTVTSVDGAVIGFTQDTNRETENVLTEMLATDGVGEWEVVAHTRYQQEVELEDDSHGLEVDDVIYFKLPFATPAIGTPDWSVRHANEPERCLHHEQTYRSINNWSASLMLVESLSKTSALSWPAWKQETRLANNDSTYLAAGYDSSARHESTFAGAFWDEYNDETDALDSPVETTTIGVTHEELLRTPEMATYTVNFGVAKTGLETVAYSILDSDGDEIIPAKTVGVTEIGSTGAYQAEFGLPNLAATILWTTGEDTPSFATQNVVTPNVEDAHVAGGPATPWQGNQGLSGGSGAGRTFLQVDNPLIGVRFTGPVSRFRTTLRGSITTGEFRLLIFRDGVRIYKSKRYFLHGSYTNASLSDVLDFALDRPVDVRAGDKIGVWLSPDTGSDAMSCRTLSAVGAIKWAEGDISAEASLSTTISLTELNIQLLSDTPYLALTGDSIAEGHGGNVKYHGYLDNTFTLGGERSSEPGYWVSKLLGDVTYENHAKGSQTFAWVASTGIPAAVASGAEVIVIHCGVNDVAGARTWAAVEGNLDTIRAAVPLTTRLIIDEILPWTDGTPEQAGTIRTWNASLATWCKDNSATLNKCHDILGQVRSETGELDDLYTGYDQDGVHQTTSGVRRLSESIVSAIQSAPDATVSAIDASTTGTNAATAATTAESAVTAIATVKAKTDLIGTLRSLIRWG